MAKFGAKHPCFKSDEASTGVVLGKLVSANLTVQLADGKIYGDDQLDESVSEFVSGSLPMETTDMTDDVAQEVYGCQVDNGELVNNTGDNAPQGRLAYYKTLMRQGKKRYQGYFYPRVKAAIGNDSAQTKGENIQFQTTSTTFTVFADDNGDWRRVKTFNSEADAVAWVEGKCGITESYLFRVTVQGAGTGDGVAPVGEFYVADGGDAELVISGTPTKLYDNGEDVTASISEGKYTLSGVDAAHEIAVIF